MNEDGHIKEVKAATLLRFNDLWRQNFQANRNAIQKNPGVVALARKFEGIPAIVVGAGPSLDKNINLLGRARDHALILASDAALKPLLSQGVTPSMVVCLDPQEEITKFFQGVSHRGMTLIAPSIVHPRVLDLWEGNVIFFHKHAPDIPPLEEIANQLTHIGRLTPGGSVLSIAYDLAFKSGANPIIFTGQDLSYPKKKTHSRDSEDADVGLEPTLEKQRNNIVYETDVNGRSLPTLKSMSVSKQWFNWAFTTWKRPGPTEIINCSEAGILTDHCSLMPLSEAIFKYCKKKINISWTIKKILK
ncbi:MAG: DUF115 domain-containing protein [Nitrospinae bacterium]|nr:DUF115 domain-containing protein [Nitrospinota bacterium]